MKDKYVLDEDGLRAERVGAWATAKYDLIRYYADMFTTSMAEKWGNLVYVDLFAGPGQAYLASNGFVDSSPCIALSLKRPFDRYIFCDVAADNLAALEARAKQRFPERDLRFVHGDANEVIDDVLRSLPPFGRGAKSMLVFCLLDPYNMKSLRFTTVQRLAGLIIDFLVLVPSYMDANRDWAIYEKPPNRVVQDFIGREDWRSDWAKLDARHGKDAFGRFVVNEFIEAMRRLGFSLGARRIVRYDHRVKLYQLLGFSRHQRGLSFWRIAERQTDPVRQTGQLPLFDDDN